MVRYSASVEKGDVCVIQSTTNAEPLIRAIYEEVLRAGGHPVFNLTPPEAQPAFFELAGDDQLDYIADPVRWGYEEADVRFAIMADVNPRALSQVDPAKQTRAQRARKPL